MAMPDVMTTDALLEVVSSIDPKRWGSKLAIVAKLGRWPDGAEAGYRDIAEVIGRQPRYTWRLVQELVADRVLEVVEAPAGRRPGTYRVNPWIGEWRGVPWTRPWELVMRRAFDEFHVEPQGHRGTTTPVVPRSGRGTRAVVPRSSIAAQRDAQRFVPRSRVAAQDPTRAATPSRHNDDGALSRGYPSGLPGDEAPTPTPAPAAPAGEEPKSHPHEVKALRVAVLSAAGRSQRGKPFLNGAPFEHLAELWRTYGAEWGVGPMVDLIAKAPTELGAPMVVRWLADELELGPLDDLDDPPAPAAQRTRAQELEAQIADMLERGYSEDDDVVQDRRTELAACKDERATTPTPTTNGGPK